MIVYIYIYLNLKKGSKFYPMDLLPFYSLFTPPLSLVIGVINIY